MKISINFISPVRSDVVLLYGEREELIKKYILKKITYQVVEPGTVFLHPRVIFEMLKIWRTSIKKFDLNFKGSFLKILKSIYETNLLAYLKSIYPRVVLTFIDDSGVFHRLRNALKDCEFFAIQNGMRLGFYYDAILQDKASLSDQISIDHYFCFGAGDVQNCIENESDVKHFSPIGSLVGGIYWGEVSQESSVEFDICYLSSFVDYPIESARMRGLVELWEADTLGSKILEHNLKNLINEKGYSVVIALKYDNSEKEMSYFYEIFGDLVTYQTSNRSDFSTYKAIDKSGLSLTGISTCAAEAMGVGKRSLFVNSLGYSGYRIPEAGYLYLEKPKYNVFRDRVSYLLSMTDSEFKRETHKARKFLMNYDLDDLPHKRIRREIKKILSN